MWIEAATVTVSFRERRPWLVGSVSILVLAAAVSGAFSINRFEGLRGVYSISADLADAAGVREGNEVRVAGVRVGQVKGVTLTDSAARIEMEISSDIQIPQETKVVVKLKTLLGQKLIDLRLPPSFVAAAAEGGDPSGSTAGYLADGDVIPIAQTEVPFEIHEAATEGTAVLEDIDKRALRRMISVLGQTFGASKEELRRALVSLAAAGEVLDDKGDHISRVLRSAEKATATLASSDESIEGILSRSAEVLGTLADRRADISSLLAATNDLAENLGLLIRVARGSIQLGSRDLNSILLTAEAELATIEEALDELGIAQRMFARPLSFGRFAEGHVCAATTADTCMPEGTPEDPKVPQHNVQPIPSPAAGVR
ncbi:MAG: MCE family protein [Actinomycetota bacterium]